MADLSLIREPDAGRGFWASNRACVLVANGWPPGRATATIVIWRSRLPGCSSILLVTYRETKHLVRLTTRCMSTYLHERLDTKGKVYNCLFSDFWEMRYLKEGAVCVGMAGASFATSSGVRSFSTCYLEYLSRTAQDAKQQIGIRCFPRNLTLCTGNDLLGASFLCAHHVDTTPT